MVATRDFSLSFFMSFCEQLAPAVSHGTKPFPPASPTEPWGLLGPRPVSVLRLSGGRHQQGGHVLDTSGCSDSSALWGTWKQMSPPSLQPQPLGQNWEQGENWGLGHLGTGRLGTVLPQNYSFFPIFFIFFFIAPYFFISLMCFLEEIGKKAVAPSFYLLK